MGGDARTAHARRARDGECRAGSAALGNERAFGMTAVVLDAGAFVAVDRGDRAMAARLRAAERSGMDLRTTGIVIAQVWRDPAGRQVELARLLNAVEVRPVDRSMGQDAGVLLARAGLGDAVDATLVAAARPGDRIVTGDPVDIRALVAASKRAVYVVPC